MVYGAYQCNVREIRDELKWCNTQRSVVIVTAETCRPSTHTPGIVALKHVVQ